MCTQPNGMYSHFPQLRTSRCLLRQIVPADIDAVYAGLSDPQVIAHYGVSYTSLADTRRQMDWFAQIERDGSGLWWGISTGTDTPLIGACGLNDIDAQHRRAELGYWLLPEHWGQGIAFECVGNMLDHAFGAMGLYRIAAEVDIGNQRSQRLLERLGFQFEGIRRGCEWKHDRFLDLKTYSRLASDAAPQAAC